MADEKLKKKVLKTKSLMELVFGKYLQFFEIKKKLCMQKIVYYDPRPEK